MSYLRFTEANPDKGTETSYSPFISKSFAASFTEANPDKGTETILHLLRYIFLHQLRLQKLTPIRGRKQ